MSISSGTDVLVHARLQTSLDRFSCPFPGRYDTVLEEIVESARCISGEDGIVLQRGIGKRIRVVRENVPDGAGSPLRGALVAAQRGIEFERRRQEQRQPERMLPRNALQEILGLRDIGELTREKSSEK